MKKYLLYIIISWISFSGCGPVVGTTSVQLGRPAPMMHPIAPMGYDMFYDELTPYGRWIDYPDEGYVWVPNVEMGFRPYATNGHWVYSDYGWTWASNYQWGWAAFHYGTWMFEQGYGWMWVPGHEWAPAWVTWGNSGNYYGWAPLAPHVNVNVSIGYGAWTPPQHYWNFVPREQITQVNLNNYVVNNNNNITVVNNISRNVTIIHNNTVINNYNTTNYNRGPQVNEVERVTNNRINPVRINASNKPGATALSNNELSTYRPQIKPNNPGMNTGRPIPARVETYKRSETTFQTIPNNNTQQKYRPISEPRPVRNFNDQSVAPSKPGYEQAYHEYREPIKIQPFNKPINVQSTIKPSAVIPRQYPNRQMYQELKRTQKDYRETKQNK